MQTRDSKGADLPTSAGLSCCLPILLLDLSKFPFKSPMAGVQAFATSWFLFLIPSSLSTRNLISYFKGIKRSLERNSLTHFYFYTMHNCTHLSLLFLFREKNNLSFLKLKFPVYSRICLTVHLLKSWSISHQSLPLTPVSSIISPLAPSQQANTLIIFYKRKLFFLSSPPLQTIGLLIISSFSSPCVHMLSCFSHVWLFAVLWTIACQPPLSMEFSKQEYWNELPFPSPGDLPDPEI